MNHLNTEFAPKPELEYPFEKRWSPEPGEPFEVADGVFWLRVPLPIALDHINLWILRDVDGWVIVDSGYDAPVCRDVWEKVFENFMTPDTVTRIVITHFHPDHIGLAAWLAHRCECKIHITRGEFDHYRHIIDRDTDEHYQQAREFIAELGFNERYQDLYVGFMKPDNKPEELRVQKQDCVFFADGDTLEIDGQEWLIVMGNGHSPEHACLFNQQKNLLIAGDQAIPRISSNVSVYMSNLDQDPLGDWLDSCKKLKTQIPADTMILPAHQEPFIGIAPRMQQLIDDHHAQLNRLRLKADTPMSATAARDILFARELNEIETIMATGESLSHINYLLHRGELSKTKLANGIVEYQAQK